MFGALRRVLDEGGGSKLGFGNQNLKIFRFVALMKVVNFAT
jgi:hypothetical protein